MGARSHFRLSLMAAGVILLSGCHNLPVTQSASSSSAQYIAPLLPPGINPRLLTLSEQVALEPIFALTDEQSERFLTAFHSELSYLPEHMRLARYLERLTSSYNYRERTLPANQAFAGTPGNCMSLVVLTTALARLVDLDIDYQRLTTNPIFDKQQGVILVSDHVRSRVFAPQDEGFILQRAHAIIDYFPSRESRRAERLDLNTLLSMYYSNLAAEHILDQNLTAATQFAEKALSFSPRHPSALNLLAILHRRIDDNDTAEGYFLYALHHHPDELNLLNNYQVLLAEQGREQEASMISARIFTLDEVNPYQLIALAQRAFNDTEYSRALRYYQRVLDIAPYLHEVYLQQAVVLEHMGQTRRASQALQDGLAQARLSATEVNYKRRVSAVKLNSKEAW